jgi:hypothetical protein
MVHESGLIPLNGAARRRPMVASIVRLLGTAMTNETAASPQRLSRIGEDATAMRVAPHGLAEVARHRASFTGDRACRALAGPRHCALNRLNFLVAVPDVLGIDVLDGDAPRRTTLGKRVDFRGERLPAQDRP